MRASLFAIAMLLAAAVPALAQDFGWIGVSIEDQRDGGAIVRRVEPGSPAEKAGLKEGDVILQFNKEDVVGVQQLTRVVRETPVGRTVDVKVRRDNREETFKITTERGPQFRSGRFELNLPDVHIFADRAIRDFPRVQVNTVFEQSGVRVEQMTDQLRDFFGVFGNSGVLVTSVDAGSAAEKAGLKAGDVITVVDGKTIRNPTDFSREMRAGSKPVLKIVRDKQEREIKFE
jgi:serine protease Do